MTLVLLLLKPGSSIDNLFNICAGTLSLHGTERTRYVRLAADAPLASSTITLAGDVVGWQVGDLLAITTSSFNPDAEEVVISAITGRTITLKSPLKKLHLARTKQYGTKTVCSSSFCLLAGLSRLCMYADV